MALKDRPILQDKVQLNWTEEELRAFATAYEKQQPAAARLKPRPFKTGREWSF